MKRTVIVTLVVSGLLFAILTTLLGQRQRVLVIEEARAAEDHARLMAQARAVSQPGEEGGAVGSPRSANGPGFGTSDAGSTRPETTPAIARPPVAGKPDGRDGREGSLAIVLTQLFPNAPLELHSVGDSILLRGDVESEEVRRQAVQIAEQFYPKVLDQLRIPPAKRPDKNPLVSDANPRAAIGEDKHGLRETLTKLYPTARIEVHFVTIDSVVIRGRVARTEQIRQITDIASQLYPKVLNYLTTDERPSQPSALPTNVFEPPNIELPADSPTTNRVPRDEQDTAMDREAKQLAARVRAAKEPEKSKLRAELEKLTEKHFEHRQQRRKQEIDDLADRVDKLRVAQHRRQENKADILKRRVDDLLDLEKEPKWDDASAKRGDQSIPFDPVAAASRPATGVSSKTPAEDEPTFDGTPYSQWLKMLEIERKPEKLATAMEACARLAATGDERRIAHGIFVAAKLFEVSDDAKDRDRVWNAGIAALKRLPGEAVVSELRAVLRDVEFTNAREFQIRFLVAVAISTTSVTPESFKSTLKSHADEFIATFLELARQREDRDHRLLAGASSVWLISERKLSNFADLQPLLLKALEELASRDGLNNYPWTQCLSGLLNREPEMPGLALVLLKYREHLPKYALELLGRMERHAAPAVPTLIEDLLKNWKLREAWLRACAAGDEQEMKKFDRIEDKLPEVRMAQIFEVLGKIGPESKAAVPLLRQIAALMPAKEENPNTRSDLYRFLPALRQALEKIGDVSDADPNQLPPVLLSDFSRISRHWKLRTLRPGNMPSSVRFNLVGQFSIERQDDEDAWDQVQDVMNRIGCPSSGLKFRLNETAHQKQIDLFDSRVKKYSQFGIYELTGDRLKIELAKPGLPRPKEFSADPDKLPEGHVLLELGRDS